LADVSVVSTDSCANPSELAEEWGPLLSLGSAIHHELLLLQISSSASAACEAGFARKPGLKANWRFLIEPEWPIYRDFHGSQPQ
jgi:hypothetical protein